MIFSGLRATPGQPPCSAPMIPWSWISITATTHVLHAHLATPSTSSCCVIYWVTHMPWTVLRPSFRSCQVEPTTCTSRCAMPNSHLRAGCQFLRCRIRICVQAANVFAVEFRNSPSSRQPIPLTRFAAWLGHSIVQPMFVNNMRCRFSFDEPTAAQICAADLCPCWHGCQHP
jgi:hypothetical protein